MCRECEGAAYGWPPILYAGQIESPILIIAQNPGDFHIKGKHFDPVRYADQVIAADTMRRIKESGVSSFGLSTERFEDWLLQQYRWDFGDSYGAKQLSLVFHNDWLQQCCYTNAVLCRTLKNELPSEEMQSNCRQWTIDLIEMYPRKIIVPVGGIARCQIIPKRYGIDAGRLKINFGIPYEMTNGTIVFPIPHYSAWKYFGGNDAAESYRKTFEELVKLAKISYLFD